MNRLRRPLLPSALALAGVAIAAVLTAPAAHADGIPFADPNAIGTIGFCDQSGHAVTSGRIGEAPFAWTAVSSVPAPKGYQAPRGRATLFAYQPIEYVDPGDWSGKLMAASSTFTSNDHPMSQATVLDPALVDFTSVFPPRWQGLVQFRMFFSAPDAVPNTATYPAAVVKVSGDTWTLISDGRADCGAGHAVSSETKNLPEAAFKAKTPRATPGITPSSAAASGPAGRGGSSAAGPASPGASGSSVTAAAAGTGQLGNAAAETSSSGAGGSSGWVWGVLGAVVLAAGAGTAFWRSRRRSA